MCVNLSPSSSILGIIRRGVVSDEKRLPMACMLASIEYSRLDADGDVPRNESNPESSSILWLACRLFSGVGLGEGCSARVGRYFS